MDAHDKKFIADINAHYQQERMLAKLADNEITNRVYRKRQGYTKTDLYGEGEDGNLNWVTFCNGSVLTAIRLTDDLKVIIVSEDVDGKETENELKYVNETDTIAIAYHLIAEVEG